MRRRGIRIFAAAMLVACAVAASAARAAWRPVGPPVFESGQYPLYRYDLKRIGHVPYVAWIDASGGNRVVRVVRLAADGRSWRPVGGVVNRDATKDAGWPSLAAGPGDTPWIAWAEYDGGGVSQIHAAHLGRGGDRWVEPDSRRWAINWRPELWNYWLRHEPWMSGGGQPEIVFLGRRPYVVYSHFGGSGESWTDIVRLADDRHSWERVLGSWVARPRIVPRSHDTAVIGGRLNLGEATDLGEAAEVFRLAPDGTWIEPGGVIDEPPDRYGGLAALTGLGGTPYALWNTDYHASYVSRLAGGGWEAAGGGPLTGDGYGESVRTVGGRLYAAWAKWDSGLPHVRYLAADGNAWIDTGAIEVDGGRPSGALLSGVDHVPYLAFTEHVRGTYRLRVSRLDGAPAAIGPDDGEGSGPGQDPNVTTRPVLLPVVRVPCGTVLVGTSSGDGMYGGPGRNVMRGLGGNDSIHGFAGDDCLSGGTGDDGLHGGGGDDRLVGNRGRDHLDGAAGRDRFNAGPGDDVIDSKDGVAEDVHCGSGDDRVKADPEDRLHGCERRWNV